MKRTRDDSFDPVYPYFYTQTSITNGALVVTGVRTGNDNSDSGSNPGGTPSASVVDAPLFLVNGHLGLLYGSGLQISASALQVAPGDGLFLDSQGAVSLKTSAPLNTNEGTLQLETGGGLQTTENGLTVNAGSGLKIDNEALQVNTGPGLQITDVNTVAVKTAGLIQADAVTGLDITVDNSLAKTNNILQVVPGPGLKTLTNGLQVAAGSGLSTLASGVNVNIGPGLRITDSNQISVRSGGGLYVNEVGTLQINAGPGFEIQSDILMLKIGAGLKISNGTLIATSENGGSGGSSGGSSSGGSSTVTLNATAPLQYANGTLTLSYSGDFVIQNSILTLNLSVQAPLTKNQNTIGLKTGPTLQVVNGTLDTALQSTAPLSLADNLVSLSYGNGLTLSAGKLTVNCEAPLTVDSSGISLQIGTGLSVEQGVLTAKNTLSLSASKPLVLSGSNLSLDFNPPFTLSNNRLGLNATRGLTMSGANLTVQVAAPLLIGNNGVQLSYSPFFTTNPANQLAPTKYCCVVSGVIPYPIIDFGDNTKASFLLVLERIGTMVHGMMRLMDCFIPFTLNKNLILHMTENGDITTPSSTYKASNTVFYTQQLVPYGGLNPASVWKKGLIPSSVGLSESYLPSRPSTPIGLLINDTGSKFLPRTITFVLNIQRDMLLHNMEPFFFSYMPLY